MTAESNPTSVATGVRSFSDIARAQLQHVAYTLGEAERGISAASGPSPLIGVLETVWEEASFLGCPSVAKLCRGIIACLSSPAMSNDSHGDQPIMDGLDALRAVANDPGSVELANRCDRCCSALESLVDDIGGKWCPTTVKPRSVPNRLATDAEVADAPNTASWAGIAKHTDASIYASDALSGMERCSHEETWIVTQVAAAAEDLASAASDVRPAHHLMRILSGHSFFQNVDRTCIVGLMPDANQLVVIDSCLHPRMRAVGVRNRMVRGYSCFVNPEGSLARMQPGVLRVFSDSQAVLDSFAREGKPPQRSIAYIAEAGLRSGLCLAIGRGETVQGYLFMNSQQPDHFRHVMRDYGPLLSLFSLLGTVALDGAGFHARQSLRGTSSAALNQAKVFTGDEFSLQFQTMMQRLVATPPSLHVNQTDAHRFLYAPASVLGAICHSVFRLGMAAVHDKSELAVNVGVDRNDVCFSVQIDAKRWTAIPRDWHQARLSELAEDYANRPLQFGLNEFGFDLRIPFEPAVWSDSMVRYSVAY